jgi:hypothetical protein
MEGVPARRLVTTYVQLYPLFQAAYQELGYPNGYFNDRLIEAIDDMLGGARRSRRRSSRSRRCSTSSPTPRSRPVRGQKIVVRMGPENAKRVKDKLRAIRRELTVQRLVVTYNRVDSSLLLAARWAAFVLKPR